jgi:hypothetical protein
LFRTLRGVRERDVILQDLFVLTRQEVKRYEHFIGNLEADFDSLIEAICTDKWNRLHEDRFVAFQAVGYTVHHLSLNLTPHPSEIIELRTEVKKIT